MATKTRKTSNSADGDSAEALYNRGEDQPHATLFEEMSIDEVRRLLRDNGLSHLIDNCVDDSEISHTRPRTTNSRTEFN
ncbi:MAG: hypothetical protein ACXV5P_09015, partial [Halobacteriota archaeon]